MVDREIFSDDSRAKWSYIPLGLVLIFSSVILGNLADLFEFIPFIQGLLMGMSVPINLSGIYYACHKRNKERYKEI